MHACHSVHAYLLPWSVLCTYMHYFSSFVLILGGYYRHEEIIEMSRAGSQGRHDGYLPFNSFMLSAMVCPMYIHSLFHSLVIDTRGVL